MFGLELEAASGGVWKKALESTLGEQKMYTTAASSLVKGVLRWVAWTIFAVGVYGSDNLLSFWLLKESSYDRLSTDIWQFDYLNIFVLKLR